MLLSNVGSIPLDPGVTQSMEDGQAFIDLFPYSPMLTAVNIITSKLLQNGKQWRSVIEGTSTLLWVGVCGIYTAGQMWLRWLSDQQLVSPYSASLLINQTNDENYSNHQLEYILLMYQQILRTLMSREMKDSDGELTVWTWYCNGGNEKLLTQLQNLLVGNMWTALFSSLAQVIKDENINKYSFIPLWMHLPLTQTTHNSLCRRGLLVN